jgi:hypothetical protein
MGWWSAVADEELRLQHNAAEQAAREAAVPAPSPQPSVPGHEDELRVAHQSSTVDNTPASGEGRGMTDEQKYGGGNC